MKTITYFEPELRASAKLANYGKMVLAFCITGRFYELPKKVEII